MLVDKVNEMQDRIKIRFGVDSDYKGPDPACLGAGLLSLIRGGAAVEAEMCDESRAAAGLAAIGHEFEFLGAPRDYPECGYCWVVEENDVLMWIVLPRCGDGKRDVTLPF
jgi:hypothetical protein